MEDQARFGQAGCSDKERFVTELEFVQCLANPRYINWLSQNRHFEDPAFVKYLEYLQYWRQPQYAKYIIYPHSLFFLELVQSKDFRTAIANNSVAEFVYTQQFFFWQHYWTNRVKETSS